MQFVTYATFFAVTMASYLTSIHALPGPFKFLPEALTGIVGLFVVAAGIRQRFHLVNPKYWLVFGGLTIVIVCGIIANSVGPGPIISGLRYYIRPMPLFLLPAVYRYSDGELRGHLRFLLGIALLQVPVELYQRHAIMAIGRVNAADDVYGTLMQSGVASTYLVCAVGILSALMLRGRLNKFAYAAMFLLLVIPMSINETKVTVIFLPAALLITFIVAAPAGKKLVTAGAALAVLVAAGAIFIPVFDYYQSKAAESYKIMDFFTKKGSLQDYLDKKNEGVGSQEEAGRVDAITVPLQQLARDPVSLAFGVGLGNASHSNLGSNFVGSYYGIYGRYTTETSMSTFLLETGVLGASMVLLLHWLVLRDTIFVARHEQGLVGVLALGMIGNICIMTLALFYIAMHTLESVSYLFWFYAGVMAAQRARAAVGATRTIGLRPAASPPGLPGDALISKRQISGPRQV